MLDTERTARRLAFGDAAEAYDRVRPKYSTAAMTAVVDGTRLGRGDRVLEIGCGTGQATAALAARRLSVVALEPSPQLAAVARERLARFDQVRVHVETFEDFADDEPYCAVVAASSFHWIDPTVRLRKTHHHLGDGGSIAILAHIHPRPYTSFFRRAQEVYERLVPEWGASTRDTTTDDVMQQTTRDFDGSHLFEVVMQRAWDWEQSFGRDDYLLLLSTFSDHRLLGKVRLKLLQDALGELIDREYGGVVVRPYRTLLTVARKCG